LEGTKFSFRPAVRLRVERSIKVQGHHRKGGVEGGERARRRRRRSEKDMRSVNK
jgi:hypothetical protein